MLAFAYLLVVLVVNSQLCFSALTDDGTVVNVTGGLIQGHILKDVNGGDYWAFQEIPYAAPPTGSNRFRLPQEPEPWDGTLNTTRNTKICYQFVSRHPDILEITEDCLYINVYTPSQPGAGPALPVLAWIHGGGFTAESGTYEYYGPKFIMGRDVVVVTFNYRLGALGFASTEDGVIPGNLGLKDQQFALRWIQKNIEAFNGDPNRVTIVGESAGSMAVGLHVMGQSDETLFHGAIMQSGSSLGLLLQSNARQNAFDLGKAVDPGFSSQDSNDLLELLQQASAADILNSGLATGVVIEQEGDFSYPGFQTYLDGNIKKIPVVIGFNSEEWGFTVDTADQDTLASYDQNPSQLIGNFTSMTPENRTIAGGLLRQIYTNNGAFVDHLGGFVRWNSDSRFSTPTLKQVELASGLTPVWLYQFSYKGKLGNWTEYNVPDMEKVVHAEDLHYWWDDTTNSDLSVYPEADQLALQRFSTFWTNFATYLDPTPFADPLFQNIRWPAVQPGTLSYLNINATLEIRQNPRQYLQVKEVLDAVIQPPYISYGSFW